MRYRYLIAGGLVLAMIALCGGMVLSVTNIEIGRRRVGKECRSRWSPYH